METSTGSGSNLKTVTGNGMGEINIIPINRDEVYGELRKRIVGLQESVIRDRWELAKELTEVISGELHIQWGYPTLKMYIEQEVRMNIRVAHYLHSIFVYFANRIGPELSPEDFSRMVDKLKKLGWTKAKCLVDVCNKDDWEVWIDRAMEMSVDELTLETRRVLVERKGGNPDDIQNMKTLSCKFYEEQYEPVEQALELAKETVEAEKPKKSNLLSLICQSFVADNMGSKSNKGSHRDRMLRRLGAIFGVDLVAVEPDTKKVLFGKDTLGKIK